MTHVAGERRRARKAAHTPERGLHEALDRAADELGFRGASLLVAVSGGIDSSVLLHGLHALREELSLELAIGHIDHGLRGGESQGDAAWVCRLGEQLGLAYEVVRVSLAASRDSASRTRPSIQEAARAERYAALDALREKFGATAIATAHTADDQAETVLLRLVRGCGPESLGAIPPVGRTEQGTTVLRPLLRVTRTEIEAYAAARALTWREDSSNAGDDYARNRMRHDVIPLLRDGFNPQLLRTLGNLADAARADGAWLGSLVGDEVAGRLRVAEDDGGRALEVECAGWGELPEALARRVVREALERVGLGREVTRSHIDRVLGFTRAGPTTGRALGLPLGWQWRCAGKVWRIERAEARTED